MRGATAQSAFTVVAQNLDNPRGLTFAADGTLYIAEAGRGGTGPCQTGPEGGEVCFGASGAVTRVAGGRQERIATGLPSYASPDGEGATGPHDVAVGAGGNLYVPVGLGGNTTVRAAYGEGGAHLGHLMRVNMNGQATPVADVAGYEQSADPDKAGPDSNPYSVLAEGDSQLVVDAGANALLRVAANGAVSTVAVFPTRIVAAPPIPNLPPELPMQSVPNTVAKGPDGAYYVGELTGFPFPVGGARVYRVGTTGMPEVYAEGFTNIIDITFGPDGSLYVLEIFAKGFLQVMGPNADPSGALTRIAPDRSRTIVASAGLIAPSSVAIGPDGGIYVSNFGIAAGGGQVVRVAQVPGGRPLPTTGEESTSLLFAETGFSLEGEFLTMWRASGGLGVFGLPIDSASLSDGKVAQWLERARFELHPANAAPYNVQLGRLGVEALERQGRSWHSFAKADPAAAHYFRETGHAITNDAFWRYWSSHGIELDRRAGTSFAESLALFGYPVSEAQVETNANGDRVLTQWFERARFEYHAGNAPAFRVLLGRLGAEVRSQRGR
jgi:hypothetical protein